MREDLYTGYPEEIDQYEGSIEVEVGADVRETKGNNHHMAAILSSPEPSSPLSVVGGDILDEPLEMVDLRNPEEIAASKKTFFRKILEDKAVLKVVHLGVAFCLLFLGFDACQDLVTTFHEKDGSAGLAILYVVFGISSFFAPTIVELVGIRLSLFSASVAYVMFIVCVEPYLDMVFYPISFVEGIAAALIWTAQPVYLNKCATNPNVLGKFSGIFYAIFQTAIIAGNLLSAALLSTNIKQENLLYILAAISFCGSIALALLRKPETKQKLDSSYTKTRTKELEIELDSQGKAHMSPPTSPDSLAGSTTSMLAASVDDVLPPVKKPKPSALLLQTLKMSISKRMLWMHPIFIHQGFSNAIFMGSFPLQMSAEKIGFVIATFGVSNVIGSIFWGKVYDLKGWKILTITAIFLGPISYFASTLNSIGLWPLFIAAVGFGILDSLQNILVFGIISSSYSEEQDKVCAFAVSKFSNALASGVSFFVIPYLSYKIIAGIATVNILLVCACIFGLYYFTSSHTLFLFNKFDFSFLDPTKLRMKHAKMHDEI